MENDPFGLMTEYGYQAPPDEELIRALMAQQQAGNTAQAAQPRLAKQMTQAEALRDKPNPRSTHWLSGLAGLGNKAAGIRDVRATQQQQIQGEQALGNSLAAQQQHAMQRERRQDNNQLAGIGLQQANRGEDIENAQGADRTKASALLKSQQAQRAHELELQRMRQADVRRTAQAAKGAPGTFRDKEGNQIVGDWSPDAGENGKGAYVDFNTGEVYDRKDTWTYGPLEIEGKEDRSYANNAEYNVQTIYHFMDKDAAEWERITQPFQGVPIKFAEDLLMNGETSGVLQWAEESGILPGSIEREALDYAISEMSRFNLQVVMPYREDTTSGPLSNQDLNEFTKNILVKPGTPGNLARTAAQDLVGKAELHAQNRLRGWREEGNEGAVVLSEAGYKQLRPRGWREQQTADEAKAQEKSVVEDATAGARIAAGLSQEQLQTIVSMGPKSANDPVFEAASLALKRYRQSNQAEEISGLRQPP